MDPVVRVFAFPPAKVLGPFDPVVWTKDRENCVLDRTVIATSAVADGRGRCLLTALCLMAIARTTVIHGALRLESQLETARSP